MSAGENPPVSQSAQGVGRQRHTFAIARRRGWKRRTLGALPPKRQVVAQYYQSGVGKRTRQTHQQRRLAIRPRAVRERDRIARGAVRPMQNTADAVGLESLLHRHLPRFILPAWAAAKLRGTNRTPRIIHRLRAPAITDDLPAIIASYPMRATSAAPIVGPLKRSLSATPAACANFVRVGRDTAP